VRSLRSNYIQLGDGFLLVYSIAARDTFEAVKGLHATVTMHKDQNADFPCIIAGSKRDLDSERQVATEEGRALTALLQTSFVETSAYTGENVSEAFLDLVRQVRRARARASGNASEPHEMPAGTGRSSSGSGGTPPMERRKRACILL
jgi:GTPase KRas